MHRAAIVISAALFVLGSSAVATADVVMPPPAQCPEGQTPRTGHSGPYCQPPLPTDCPPEHLPKVHLSHAYCEPPPLKACPAGSFWDSNSETDTFCRGRNKCETQDHCGAVGTCSESSLCVKLTHWRRGAMETVFGSCKTDADCSDGATCAKAKRCDVADKRVASSPDAAKPVTLPPAASSVPDGASSAAPSASPTASSAPSTSEPPAPPPQGGCAGCSLGSPATGGQALWLFALLAGVLHRRRRTFR